jgi:hypothetical protein
MAPGAWAMAPPAAGADAALASPGTTQNILIFGGQTFYDPVNKRIPIVGADHGQSPKTVGYDLKTHSWSIWHTNTPGSHAYQHTAVDPETGDVFLLSIAAGAVYRWSGSDWALHTMMSMFSDPAAQMRNWFIATALCWWNGKLTWFTGFGTVYAFDAVAKVWLGLGQHPSGMNGAYHNIAVPTPDALLFGGGNVYDNGSGEHPDGRYAMDQTLVRLGKDGAVTPMPAAPYRVGIYNGMLASGGGGGKVNLLGFGEFWQLDPETVSMTRLPDPPAGLMDPVHQSVMACSIDELGCTAYFQWHRNASPASEVWIYKHA